MTRIVLDSGTVAKLQPLSEPVELCDESGRVLGESRPGLETSSRLPEGFDCPFSDEELERRRSSSLPRYTTQEVLQRLENL